MTKHTIEVKNIVIDYSERTRTLDIYVRQLPEKLEQVVGLMLLISSMGKSESTQFIHNREKDPSYLCIRIHDAKSNLLQRVYNGCLQIERLVDAARENNRRAFLAQIDKLFTEFGFHN